MQEPIGVFFLFFADLSALSAEKRKKPDFLLD